MSALTFTFKTNNKSIKAVDCRQLTPNELAKLSNQEIASLVLPCISCAPMAVGDLFDISGSDTSNIIFKNISTSTAVQFDYIGYGMTEGQITVEGDAGDYLGANMQGGILICQGNVKARTADKMRRGIMLIDGNVGAYCCSRMIAGTVAIGGNVGSYLGYGLKRGTILLNKKPKLSATWLDCGMHNLPFLSILFNAFKPIASKFSSPSNTESNNTRVQRWMGDASQAGKGEILIIQD